MMVNFLLLLIAFVVLVKGADFFVKGSSSIAIKLGISSFVVGLTIVAMGTSAPEVFVNINAVLHNSAELSIGNSVGSNIVNILLGLGLASIFIPLSIKKRTVWKEIPFSLVATFMLLVLGGDCFIEGADKGVISRIDGIVLLGFFILFIVYTFHLNDVEKSVKNGEEKIENLNLFLSSFYIVGGLLGLIFGGKYTVIYAVKIAEQLGLSENLVGLTVIAIGTSLPEIVTSIIGARKKHFDLVVGGILGSCIFNIFFILGLTSLVGDLPFTLANVTDVLFLIFVNMFLFVSMFIGEKHSLKRFQGIVFVISYVIYMIFAVLRG